MRYVLLIATLLLFTLGCEKVGSKVGLQATTQASPSSPGLPEKQERQIAEEERKAQAEEKARKIREKLGDGIEAQIGYQVQGFGELPSLYRDYIGYQFSNVRMFVNRKTGTLTIIFDCQFSKNVIVPAIPMLVRLFDENGQSITHFVTEERYAAPVQFSAFSQEERELAHIHELKQEHNYLQYLLNLRDAAYIQKAEFGVFINK